MPFDTTNRGELYREENKKSQRGPDYTGSLDVGGVKYRLAGWVKESKKSGKKFLSLKAELKDGSKAKSDFDDDFSL